MNNHDFYRLSIDDVLGKLNSSNNGLSNDEAAKRLNEYGPNELQEKAKEPAWKLLVSQFNNLLIYILMLSALISILLGKTVEPIAIIIIVVLAGITGFIQEFQAGKAIDSLRKMASPTARVLRNGKEYEIPSAELVPGDILLVNAGDKIPTDARIINASMLRVDEAALTGESLPVHKTPELIEGDNIPLGDRKNSLYMGTSVVLGRAVAVVTNTGMQTEFGKIANMLNETETRKTPLQMSLDKLGKQLGIFSLVLASIVSFFDFLRGSPIYEVFIWGVALAVAIIPEALPAVVTITLALGVKRMVRRKALIRKLPAVETLGATNIICSDKTGTLTQDEMTIKKIYCSGEMFDVSGTGYQPKGQISSNGNAIDVNANKDIMQILIAGSLCNDSTLSQIDGEWHILGDPTEGAIVVAAEKANIKVADLKKQHTRVDEVPFSSETKKMTTVNKFDNKLISFSKGAPEIVLASCKYYYKSGEKLELTEQIREEYLEVYKHFAENALRVLGISQKEMSGESDNPESEMTYLGMVAMIDPPREEVKPAIATCETAGIKPIMITGDHKVTAIAIARELGILKNGKAISGPELENMSDEELDAIINDVEVFARISPAHKMKIVDTLIKKGNVVAMTGDGVNDAPSLKRADIGVAMGITGTDVSKEASDMILTDDNFASIVAAVEEGRSIFENIRKYLVYLLSGNMGTVLGLVAALLMGFAAPLTAVHILFINFVMDGILAITLGVEPPEKGIMNKKPRPLNEGILNKESIIYISSIGLWIGFVCMAMFIAYAGAVPDEAATKAEPYSMSIFYTVLIMARIFNALSTRSISDSFLSYGIKGNMPMMIGIVVSVLLSVATVNLPFMNKIFSTVPLSLNDWLYITLAGASVLIYSEIHKLVMKFTNK